jgi:hypothetical protein
MLVVLEVLGGFVLEVLLLELELLGLELFELELLGLELLELGLLGDALEATTPKTVKIGEAMRGVQLVTTNNTVNKPKYKVIFFMAILHRVWLARDAHPKARLEQQWI